ncbi:MAG: ABC transporter substrate-binding protein [Puniceicoccales bacterium]|jgi:iron complex transport system substrate-binding protein|nr:ABC transporter substrate-binding protein [Puniceicoccales bacterium]
MTRHGFISLFAAALSVPAFAASARPPLRVVSQTVLTDEVLLAIADAGQIAALSHLSRDPRFCADAERARAFLRLPRDTGVEAVLKLCPDLVLFADFSRPELTAQLRRSGAEVWFFGRYDTLEETYAGMLRLAKRLGSGALVRAESVIADCRRRAAALEKRLRDVKPVRVFAPSTYEIVPGDKTNFQDYCDRAGAENIAKTFGGLTGHCPAPNERILGWPVEKVVVTGEVAGGGDALPDRTDVERALRPFRRLQPYRHLAAVREGRAAVLKPWQISCVSHHRTLCCEYLARQLHPEVF